ncbi:CapA family protein [Halostreptopolyspora alba]|uniref:CapA family protein n=1 Tax=Halostreptopolyspora alba TaxID=2487137 RepID=A0A3N0EFX4_9ACTN|nr:CapA family protein [Nocardiopsaceae bacterium YIM 96095]
MSGGALTLFLCGDVMTGRGVDQILPYPGDPRLWESSVRDARTYVELAERVNGRIARPVGFGWPWGDALELLDRVAPHARVINLETSVTGGGEVAAGKAVHYRMSPDNLPGVTVARPDACVLANNHVLDFGRQGLADTLQSLATAGVPAVGAGGDLDEARRPVAIPWGDGGGGGRVWLVAFGARSSGIPDSWAAGHERSGVNLLPDLSDDTADEIAGQVRRDRAAGDVAVVSLHWGGNWGYDVPDRHARFARRLIDGGVDLVHGHSSHHPRPVEVYRGRLVLYGCGDMIDDYEGISGHEEYRDDLRPMYLVSVRPDTGELVELRVAVMRARRMRLCWASREDTGQMRDVFDRIGRRFGTRFAADDRGLLRLLAT